MIMTEFQFKHCTIIRPSQKLIESAKKISIQALYDYKADAETASNKPFRISIQALYDYKTTIQQTRTSCFHFNSSIVRL